MLNYNNHSKTRPIYFWSASAINSLDLSIPWMSCTLVLAIKIPCCKFVSVIVVTLLVFFIFLYLICNILFLKYDFVCYFSYDLFDFMKRSLLPYYSLLLFTLSIACFCILIWVVKVNILKKILGFLIRYLSININILGIKQ